MSERSVEWGGGHCHCHCQHTNQHTQHSTLNYSQHKTQNTNHKTQPSDASLGECFERNREGMLKNMAIHELCLLVSFFDVTVENIAKVEVDKSFSSMKSLKGPSGDTFTDFDKIKFKIFTKTGAGKNGVSVQADRCGGERAKYC